VQEKIGEKVVGERGMPTKFPAPDGAMHVILTDVRGLLCSDVDDYKEAAYGATAFPRDEQWKPHSWNGAPIRGLFDPTNPLEAAQLIRERIHFFGFVNEQSYAEGEIADRARYFPNPNLFSDDDDWKESLASYPLRPPSGHPS
jgi:hypothetical protein